MSKLFFIRHGQASFGSDNYDQLSVVGRQQAAHLGGHLQTRQITFDAIYSGSLERQKDTAIIALSKLAPCEHHIDARLNEIDMDQHLTYLLPELIKTDKTLARFVADGLSTSKQYQKVIKALFNAWVAGLTHEQVTPWQQFRDQARAAVADIMAQQGSGKTIGVFTSGGTMATIMAGVMGLPDESAYQLYEPIINCAISECFYSGDRISISNFNDYSYLYSEPGLVTYR